MGIPRELVGPYPVVVLLFPDHWAVAEVAGAVVVAVGLVAVVADHAAQPVAVAVAALLVVAVAVVAAEWQLAAVVGFVGAAVAVAAGAAAVVVDHHPENLLPQDSSETQVPAESCRGRWKVRWSWASGVAEVWAAGGPEAPAVPGEPCLLLTWVALSHEASWVGQREAWAGTLVGSSWVGVGQP